MKRGTKVRYIGQTTGSLVAGSVYTVIEQVKGKVFDWLDFVVVEEISSKINLRVVEVLESGN